MKRKIISVSMAVLWGIIFTDVMHSLAFGICYGILMGIVFGLFDSEKNYVGPDNNTRDKVFLLSIQEAEKYFKTDEERVTYMSDKPAGWWLRSPGLNNKYASYVYNYGAVQYTGDNAGGNGHAIRPVLWIINM